MKRVATIALAVAALAGTAVDAQAAQVRDLSGARPSLISDVSITGNDSELVRAAKKTVAARLRDASRSSGVLINDVYLREHQAGRISVSSGAVASLPPLPGDMSTQTKAASAVNAPNIVSVDRAAIERENQRLRDEQARAAAEMDEPYGGNATGMEEDRAEQRSTQIPQQIQKNNQQLNSHP
jgi:hypothetical protein